MAATAYQGHATYSSSKAAGTNSDNIAPAERANYNPDTVATTVPGAAARAEGWPRADGRALPSGIR